MMNDNFANKFLKDLEKDAQRYKDSSDQLAGVINAQFKAAEKENPKEVAILKSLIQGVNKNEIGLQDAMNQIKAMQK